MKTKIKNFLKKIGTPECDESYKLGMDFYNQNMFKEAAHHFECIIKTGNTKTCINYNLARFYCAQAYKNSGVILFAKGEFKESLNHFKKALNINPNNYDLYYFSGVCLNNLGNFQGAFEAYKMVFNIDPENLPTQLKMSITLHNLKMWEKAEKINRRILEKKSNYADVNFRLGLALLGQGKINEAVKYFDNAVRINPNYINAQIQLAICKAWLGQTDEAICSLNLIINKFPGFSDILYVLGNIYADKNDINKGIEYLKKALEINPQYKDAKMRLAIFYYRTGEFVSALNELKEADNLFPNDEAIKSSIRAIAKIVSKEDLDGFTSLNKIYGEERDIKILMLSFSKQLDIIPKFSEMLSVVSGKDVVEADKAFSKSIIPLIKDYINQNPNYPDLYNNLGRQLMVLDQTDEAITYFNESLKLNPQYINSRINILKAFMRVGKYEEALSHGEYLLTHELNYPDVYSAVAECLFKLSRYEESLQVVEKALKIDPLFRYALYIRDQIYEKIGDKKK